MGRVPAQCRIALSKHFNKMLNIRGDLEILVKAQSAHGIVADGQKSTELHCCCACRSSAQAVLDRPEEQRPADDLSSDQVPTAQQEGQSLGRAIQRRAIRKTADWANARRHGIVWYGHA